MENRETIEVEDLGGEMERPAQTYGPVKKKKNEFKKGFLSGVAASLAAVLILGAVGSMVLTSNGYVFTTFKPDKNLTGGILSESVETKLSEILGALSAYYYDEVDQETAAEGLYTGLVDSLGDPYSRYFTKEEYRDYLNSSNGTYYGIGAVLTQNTQTGEISISRVYEGSPANEAGLKAGDVFVSADEFDAEGADLSEFVTHVKGDEGTTVKITVLRDGKEKTFTVERRKVEVPTVEHQMLQGNTGYIEILEFDAVTTDQFETALEDLKKQGMTSLIVDLRDNPGGMVTSVTEILDTILPKGLLVYTQDKDGNKKEYKSDKRELGLPLAVLVNENSASASEIFAGAVKDYEYGTIIGTTTFGKGIVQVLTPLSDGSAIKVTTAKYFTPNGNYIHGVGIDPDIELEFEYQGDEDEDYDIMKDNQVLKALEILSGDDK